MECFWSVHQTGYSPARVALSLLATLVAKTMDVPGATAPSAAVELPQHLQFGSHDRKVGLDVPCGPGN